jgi:agmatinase
MNGPRTPHGADTSEEEVTLTGLEPPVQPFYGGSVLSRIDQTDHGTFAFIGIPTGSPYDAQGVHSPAAGAPDHVRSMSWEQECQWEFDHYDFDLGGSVLPSGARPAVVDHGDVVADPRDLEGSKRFATDLVRSALRAGALPLIVGGDDSIPPIVLRAYEDLGPVNVLHVDAHIDFREHLHGIPDGYSSPIRRIRDMAWVGRIVQVGMRGVGSARAKEFDAALQAGNVIVPAAEVHGNGIARVIDQLVDDAPWFITIDVDGFDPSVAPGTGFPVPGGLTFAHGAALIRSIGERGLLAGIDVTEIYPDRDVRGLTALATLRLLVHAMAFAARGAGREDCVLPARWASIAGEFRPPE